MRRGSGEPRKTGFGCCAGSGVKTSLGATGGTAGLNGVGVASAARAVCTYSVCDCES